MGSLHLPSQPAPLSGSIENWCGPGKCKGQYDACFSASAARGYRRRCAPRPRPPTPHVDQEARCARAISPLGRYGALQSGRRQPCRPPPHTRASVVARAYLAERICPRVPPLWPWHPRAYIAPRLRGRPKLPSLSACTDGCPSCVRLSTISRACREGIKGMPAKRRGAKKKPSAGMSAASVLGLSFANR